jgi:chromosome segregation ATPase
MEDRTRFEVLLESIQRDVKVIAEAHGALAERLDRFETRLDRLEGRFEQVAIQVAVLDAKVNALETRVNALETRVNALETRVNALETRVNALETKLDALSADTQHRLQRIETHLGLDGSPRSRKRRQRGAQKRRKASRPSLPASVRRRRT